MRPASRADWMGPPRRAVPTVVSIERVVARNDEVGIYLGCFSAYPAGFEFEVFVTAKDELTDLDPLQFDHTYRGQGSGEIPPGQLRLGFQFSDGTKVTNTWPLRLGRRARIGAEVAGDAGRTGSAPSSSGLR